MPSTAPFGRWPSPLPASAAAAGKVSLSEVASDGTSLYWLESRPSEGGRVVCVRSTWDGDGGAVRLTEMTAPDVTVRSRVHEYGGGAWCLATGLGVGAFAYVNLHDQRVWLVGGVGHTPVALTDEPPTGETWNHGGLSASADGAFMLCVRECHRSVVDGGGSVPPQAQPPPVRSIVAMGTGAAGAGSAGTTTLAEGHDFFGAPALDVSGQRLVCVVWDHPDMQWDASRVVVTPVRREVDALTGLTSLIPAGPGWVVTGGPEESVGQPSWRADGSLLLVSDKGGWWQPYGHSGQDDGLAPVALSVDGAEFHGPDWPLRLTTMADMGGGRVVARRTQGGLDSLVVLLGRAATSGVGAVTLDQPCVSISAVCRHGSGVAFIGATWQASVNVWVLPDVDGGSEATALRPIAASASDTPSLGPDDVSVGQSFSLHGRSGRPVYGVFYPPTLHDTEGPQGALPPLVVFVHGGPTSSAGAGYDVVIQYFTSRGFACAAVDYAGSTGYGRDYRCSLWGLWGVADAEDCVDAAQHLAARGLVDGTRMAIRGGSSGGLTALNALLSDDGFSTAATLYGVTDLLGLVASTHDFEARYMDRLVGALPEAADRYAERSPIHRAADLKGAVLLLQGTEDAVVPPSQAEGMRDALVAAGQHCVVRFFEGEGHGFRRADTLVAALEEELAFYQDVLHL